MMAKLFARWFKRNFSNPQAVILALLLIAGFLAIYLMGQILMPLLVAAVFESGRASCRERVASPV